jgi:hypothetical protein
MGSDDDADDGFDFSTCPPCRRLASAKLRIKEISRTVSLLSSNVA